MNVKYVAIKAIEKQIDALTKTIESADAIERVFYQSRIDQLIEGIAQVKRAERTSVAIILDELVV
jgi:hypothetical protein